MAGLAYRSMRRMALLIAAALVVASASPVVAGTKATAAKTSSKAAAKKGKSSVRKSSSNKGTMKQCSSSGGKRKCKRVAVFQGHGAAQSSLRTQELTRPSGNVWLYAENLAEEAKVNIYKADGTFDDAALAKLAASGGTGAK